MMSIFGIIPRFCRFCSLEEDGIFSRIFHKTWDIGRTDFQYPPCLRKTWDIGRTDFQYPPCSENVGYWEDWFSISPLFAKNVGYWDYWFPISPCLENVGYWNTVLPICHSLWIVSKMGNHQNLGIMWRFHLFPRDLWEICSPRAYKTVLGLRPRTVL